MKIITVANHKGGTGKSFTTQNLSAVLAKYHQLKVLMIDLDPQSSLSQSCDAGNVEDNSMAEVIGGSLIGNKMIRDIIIPVSSHLWLAPSDIALSDSEMGLINRVNREHVLERVLQPVRDTFDVILVDTPPSKSLLLQNALACCDLVLVPSQPVGVDMRGLRLFLDTLEMLRGEMGRDLETWILPTFYSDRLPAHRQTVEAMLKAGWPVLDVKIPRSIRASEAASFAVSIDEYAPTNPVNQAYIQLGQEVARWLNAIIRK